MSQPLEGRPKVDVDPNNTFSNLQNPGVSGTQLHFLVKRCKTEVIPRSRKYTSRESTTVLKVMHIS